MSTPIESKLMKMMADCVEDAKALKRVLAMLEREGGDREHALPQAEVRRVAPKEPDKVITASMIEMVIGASPKGMTTTELLEALRQNGARADKQRVYNFVHYLKHNGRIRTSPKSRRHHVVAHVSKQLAEGAED